MASLVEADPHAEDSVDWASFFTALASRRSNSPGADLSLDPEKPTSQTELLKVTTQDKPPEAALSLGQN